MNYRGHLVGGVLFVGATAWLTQPSFAAATATLALSGAIGALAPDIDEPGSYLSRRLGPLYPLFWLPVYNPLTYFLLGGPPVASEPGWGTRLLRRLLGRWCVQRVRAGRARVHRAFRHRGLTHTVLALGVGSVMWGALTLGVWVLVYRFAPVLRPMLQQGSVVGWGLLGFFWGFVSHLVLDMMTVSGVPLLYPMSERRYWVLPRSLRVSTSVKRQVAA